MNTPTERLIYPMFDREMLTETVVPTLLSRETPEQQGSYLYGLLVSTEYNALSDAVDAMEAAAIITEDNGNSFYRIFSRYAAASQID